ncbi:sensor histidine kinase [Paenibacillus sp. O199]|uniref:cache domain-containing sensor histidine kinase n=1 Tax=Paenibacillus sp. O199 TaxID=1643925 RepID=UPI0007BF257B|nr:sensor histidine kinase [Paenibacillus sp. O199]
MRPTLKPRLGVRFKMIGISLIGLLIPALAFVLFVPSYYNKNMTHDINFATQATISSALINLNTYIEDLERLVVVPYLNDSIMDAFNTFRKIDSGKTVSLLEQLQATRTMNTTLPNYTQNLRKDITGTLVCFIPKTVFAVYTNNSGLVSDYPFTEQTWYKQALAAEGKTVFISSHKQDYLTDPAADKVFSIVKLVKDLDTRQPIAVVKADADTRVLSVILDKIKLNVSSIMSVIDEQGNVIYSNKPLSDTMLKELRNKSNSSKIDDHGEVYSVTTQHIEKTDWNMVAMVSETEYINRINIMQATVTGVYVLVSIFSVLLVALLSQRMMKPLRKMMNVMAKVETGNFNVRVPVRGRDEIAILGSSFNLMLSEVNNLLNREYRAVLSKQSAEYKALQSQIEPHFLYNTLNTMIGINRLGDSKVLEQAILSLTGMMRYMTEQADWTTLNEEFQMLNQYCYLQKLRFQNRLEYTIQLDPEAEPMKIPKLLIQPLVENAIVHGIEPLGETGQLTVLGSIETVHFQRCVVIVIEDSGTGLEQTEGSKWMGVGLTNVKNRLQYAYKKADLNIQSRVNVGTRITITIPLEDDNDEDRHS